MYTSQRIPVKLTDEKKAALQELNATIDLAIIVQTEILEEAKAEFKANTESIKKQKGANLQTLRQGYELLDCKVLEIIDEDQGVIQYVDEEGLVLHERALTLEERRQYRINFGRKQLVD